MNRDKSGKYAKRGFKFAVWMIVLSMLVFGSYPFFMKWYASQEIEVKNALNIVPVADAAETVEALWGDKLKAKEDEVIGDIEQCESHGDYGLIVFDSNNEASVAGLQYQRATVIHYVKKFERRDITKADAIAIAINKGQAWELARHIIFEEDATQAKDGSWHGSWANWFNCSSQHNVHARVDAIKSLMK